MSTEIEISESIDRTRLTRFMFIFAIAIALFVLYILTNITLNADDQTSKLIGVLAVIIVILISKDLVYDYLEWEYEKANV